MWPKQGTRVILNTWRLFLSRSHMMPKAWKYGWQIANRKFRDLSPLQIGLLYMSTNYTIVIFAKVGVYYIFEKICFKCTQEATNVSLHWSLMILFRLLKYEAKNTPIIKSSPILVCLYPYRLITYSIIHYSTLTTVSRPIMPQKCYNFYFSKTFFCILLVSKNNTPLPYRWIIFAPIALIGVIIVN
jgi:hypothetical protein